VLTLNTLVNLALLLIRLSLVMGELSSLLTVKTLTGMTTDAYPRKICLRGCGGQPTLVRD
jgi:hypothetical protein